MGSIWIWYELVCGDCAEAHFGKSTRGHTFRKRELVKEAKSGGWRFDKDGQPYCGPCSDRRDLK